MTDHLQPTASGLQPELSVKCFEVERFLAMPPGDKLDAMLALVGFARGDVCEHHGETEFDRAAWNCLADLRDRLTETANLGARLRLRTDLLAPLPAIHAEKYKDKEVNRAAAGTVIHNGGLDFGWHWNGFRTWKRLPAKVRHAAWHALAAVCEICVQGRAQELWGGVSLPRWRAPRIDILAGLHLVGLRHVADTGPAASPPFTPGRVVTPEGAGPDTAPLPPPHTNGQHRNPV